MERRDGEAQAVVPAIVRGAPFRITAQGQRWLDPTELSLRLALVSLFNRPCRPTGRTVSHTQTAAVVAPAINSLSARSSRLPGDLPGV